MNKKNYISKKIKDVYSNISIFNNNYSSRYNIINSFNEKEKNIVDHYENIIVVDGDENINFDQNKDIDIINLWTDFYKGFANL